jgi:hypothetical protein
MALWKINDSGPSPIPETRLKDEKFLEKQIEDWIAKEPSLLGEPLLIIGRQVIIQDTKDRLDLLALDPQGAAVVIELKRDDLKEAVDTQALRYASYISKWQFENFENVARNYLGKIGDDDFNFNDYYESFCEASGVDEIPDLNGDQRIIIVGSAVREKLGSVALWLREHSVDIKLIEIQAYKESGEIIVQPNVIVPLQVSRFKHVGKVNKEGTPWMTDGESWHLEKRCSPKTKEMFLTLNNTMQNMGLDGPHWKQKYYVAYRINGYNWLCVLTKSKLLTIDIHVKANSFNQDEIANELGTVKFDKDESLADKLSLPSSISIKNIRESTDRIRIRAKDDFDLTSETFTSFLDRAYKVHVE